MCLKNLRFPSNSEKLGLKPSKRVPGCVYRNNYFNETMKLRLKTLRRSRRPEKKWDAVFEYPDGHTKTTSFGARGMSDYTKHKDVTRRARYLKRHKGMHEDWNDPTTAGALSRWILWNKPSFRASVADYKRRFKLF